MHADLGATWTTPDGIVEMTVFAIHDHPLDYPDGFVVRRHWVLRGQADPVVDVVPRFAKTLEEARAWIPQGFVRMTRMQADDLSIYETWI
jgi:hypothetical protein